MLAGGACQAEAGSGGTKLAFGANHFQSQLPRPGARRVPLAGSPAKAGRWYWPRARGDPPPSGMGPCTQLRWRTPRPHFPTKNGQGSVHGPRFPSQNSEDQQGPGRDEGGGRGSRTASDSSGHLPGWWTRRAGPARREGLCTGNRIACPYK